MSTIFFISIIFHTIQDNYCRPRIKRIDRGSSYKQRGSCVASGRPALQYSRIRRSGKDDRYFYGENYFFPSSSLNYPEIQILRQRDFRPDPFFQFAADRNAETFCFFNRMITVKQFAYIRSAFPDTLHFPFK